MKSNTTRSAVTIIVGAGALLNFDHKGIIPTVKNITEEVLKLNIHKVDGGERPLLFDLNKHIVDKLKEAVRAMMMKLFVARNFRVESNPTSNLMIGPFDMYKELPTLKFYDENINVSVNTDAKGVFSTSLYTEYSLLALAMQKDGKDWNTEIKPRIVKLIENSRGQRFGEMRLNVPRW